MINKINFTGKAYFLDKVNRRINPEHKQRIEEYAKKLDKDTDVVVFGQTVERGYLYQGRFYTQDEVCIGLENDDINIKIRTPQGVRTAKIEDIKPDTVARQVYNAYIFADYNKENLNIQPYRKQFDFTLSADDVLIRPDNHLEEDTIKY
jgi:ABC-type Fe3+-citrate transport system substrate-binding protein